MKKPFVHHLCHVYGTICLGLVFTAIGTNLGLLYPISAFFIGILCMIGSLCQESYWSQLPYFIGFSLCQGFIITDICAECPRETLWVAGGTTGAIFVTMTLAALASDNDLGTMGFYTILGTILNAMVIVSLVNLYVQSVELMFLDCFVGIGVFSLYVYGDTVKMVWEFENGHTNIISHAIGIYLDILNLFIRILILVCKKEEEDKDRKTK